MAVLSKRKTVYICDKCKEEYDTREEAEECNKTLLPKDCKIGDLVSNSRGIVFRIGEEDPFGKVQLERIDEALWMHGRTAAESRVPRFFKVRKFSCGYGRPYRKFEIEEIQNHIAKLHRMKKVAEKFSAKEFERVKGRK